MELLGLLQYSPDIASSIRRSPTVTLILHPISACLTFLAMIFSFRLAVHGWAAFVLVIAVLAGITSTGAFALDLALVVHARNQLSFMLSQESSGLHVEYGNAVWMTLAGVGCVWASIVLLAARVCYCCGIGWAT